MKHYFFALHLLKKILLKHSLLILFILYFGLNCSAQNFQLKVIGNHVYENKVIDSLGYNLNHKNSKSISDEIHLLAEKLSKIGYLENQIIENTKTNDSSYITKFKLGERIKFIHIYIGRKIIDPILTKEEEFQVLKDDNSITKDLIELNKTKDTLILPYSKIESFLNSTLQKLEQKGHALAKLKLTNIQKKNNSLYAELQLESGQQRQLNSIVLKFAESNKKTIFQ